MLFLRSGIFRDGGTDGILFTGIMLLPVLYMLVYRTGLRSRSWFSRIRISNPLKEHTLDRFYDAGVDWVFAHKTVSVAFCILSVPLCVFLFYFIGKERMPDIDQNELIARVEWNENIHVDENRRRVDALFSDLSSKQSNRQRLWVNRIIC